MQQAKLQDMVMRTIRSLDDKRPKPFGQRLENGQANFAADDT